MNEMIKLMYSVNQKIPPPEVFWHFLPNGWEFLVKILQLICVHIYAGVQIFIQLHVRYLQLDPGTVVVRRRRRR